MTTGSYPTPVERFAGLSGPHCELWVKRDDQTHARYGGNKVRKLEHLLAEARRRGAKRLVTIGAGGSHHVLATVIHGANAGFRVAAVLAPQPWSHHAEDNLRAGLKAGLEASVARSFAEVPVVLAGLLSRGDYFIPPGGSSARASVGYADAVRELASQIHEGALPAPDVIVAALGSGGTIAGIVAGVHATALRCRVVGVRVVEPPLLTRASTLLLAHAVSRRIGDEARLSELGGLLEVDDSVLGRGYAYPTPWGARAMKLAGEHGLELEPTYTAKAFASVLRAVEHGAAKTLLYWHTLSSAPMGPLLEGAPELPDELRGLFFADGADAEA